MNKRKKMIITMMIISMICLMILPNISRAALQANGEQPTTKNTYVWMSEIRQMQAAGGALGLTDTINVDMSSYQGDLTSGNKNLDIHMEKNTEFGALAILSASSYGNPNHIADGETTTGNKTGVVMRLNNEKVAAGPTASTLGGLQYSQRYWDAYTSDYSASMSATVLRYEEKKGDAYADEMTNWHGSKYGDWMYGATHNSYFPPQNYLGEFSILRSTDGSIFSTYGLVGGFFNRDTAWSRSAANIYSEWNTRAVVVVGSGI